MVINNKFSSSLRSGMVFLALCMLPLWVFAANIKSVDVKHTSRDIKLILESDRPVEYQIDFDEVSRKFSVNLQGADYYLALTEYFQHYNIDSLSQCIDEIAIIPISEFEATFQVKLGRGMVASVYEESSSNNKAFRAIVLFEALDYSKSPCFKISHSSISSPTEMSQQSSSLPAVTKLPEADKAFDLATISPQRASEPITNEAESPGNSQKNGDSIPDQLNKPFPNKLKNKKLVRATVSTPAKVAAVATRQAGNVDKYPYTNLSGFLLADYLLLKNNKSGGDGLLHRSKSEIRTAQVGIDGAGRNWQYEIAIRAEPGLDNETKTTVYRARAGYSPWKSWRLSMGLMLEPFGGEQETEMNHILFLEKSLASTLSPTHNPGLSVTYNDEEGSMHWALGVFHKRSETDDPVSEQSLAARLWFEPLHAANQSLSFNIAVNQWRPVDNHIAYSAGPESNLIAPLFIVDQTEVDSVNTLGISAESFVEQLTVAAEFNSSAFSVDGSANTTTQVKSVGAQSLTLGWFFTGDKRQRRNGAIQPVQPIHPWGARGWGALEASIRYSRLFDDQNQKLKDISFGLNWYLNRHFVAKANWISAAYSSQDQSLDAVITEVRLQVSY